MQTTVYRSFEELPAMLTTKHVQDVLGVSRVVAYNTVNTTGFPSIRIGSRGGKILIPKDAFLQWLNRQASA